MTYALETRAETSKSRQILEANEVKVVKKQLAEQKQIEKEANKENPVVSNLLVSGWKEEENGTNM